MTPLFDFTTKLGRAAGKAASTGLKAGYVVGNAITRPRTGVPMEDQEVQARGTVVLSCCQLRREGVTTTKPVGRPRVNLDGREIIRLHEGEHRSFRQIARIACGNAGYRWPWA